MQSRRCTGHEVYSMCLLAGGYYSDDIVTGDGETDGCS